MTTYEQKKQLYRDYISELSGITGKVIGTPKDADRWCDEYIAADYAKWINLWNEDNTRLIGFLIICKPPACPEGSDRFIDQAYVVPEYRQMGLMENAVKSYVDSHRQIFGLMVYEENVNAATVWDLIFEHLGYRKEDKQQSAPFAEKGMILRTYVPKNSKKKTKNHGRNGS